MYLKYGVSKSDSGQRAVDVLRRGTGMSRLMCKKIRLYGLLTRNGQPHRMIDPVFSGDILEAYLDHAGSASILRDNIPLEIRYQDDWLLIVNKPAGMVTHPNWMYHKGSLTDILSERPLHPVTRLDRNTSGAVLVALNGHAHHVISGNPMAKDYIGFIHGRFSAPKGLIQAPIKRAENSIIERIAHKEGARAITLYKELRFYPSHDASIVRFRLITGRTHQIRVHCRAAGHPLIGDSMYGLAGTENETDLDSLIGRQALHAAKIQFHHPVDSSKISVSAPLPPDLRKLLEYLGDN